MTLCTDKSTLVKNTNMKKTFTYSGNVVIIIIIIIDRKN